MCFSLQKICNWLGLFRSFVSKGYHIIPICRKFTAGFVTARLLLLSKIRYKYFVFKYYWEHSQPFDCLSQMTNRHFQIDKCRHSRQGADIHALILELVVITFADPFTFFVLDETKSNNTCNMDFLYDCLTGACDKPTIEVSTELCQFHGAQCNFYSYFAL